MWSLGTCPHGRLDVSDDETREQHQLTAYCHDRVHNTQRCVKSQRRMILGRNGSLWAGKGIEACPSGCEYMTVLTHVLRHAERHPGVPANESYNKGPARSQPTSTNPAVSLDSCASTHPIPVTSKLVPANQQKGLDHLL